MPQNGERICTLMNILNINERVDEGAFDANKKKHRKHELLLVTLQMKDVLQVNATNADR
jgi:hypothetical protein